MADRNTKLIRIAINGQDVDTQPDTTVAAALAAHHIRATRTSVSGQARTAVCGMGICQECRVTINDTPHVLACQTIVQEGMLVFTSSP
ncbi:(2Fe-2S)-binding protein [Ralstonia syzygii]|uniref:Putative 2Fe-2S ferredoxin n=1 Tax=Ralstonia syzygii R24 TaxID=907261 RepID=G2ZZB5_9RALS|nr:(2Fe-2S)-binding protein [Ralstonia syzygii]CCA84214.1 putative 2Fe-2S ferredoxin [Ralstonia syzygii R24]